MDSLPDYEFIRTKKTSVYIETFKTLTRTVLYLMEGYFFKINGKNKLKKVNG